MKNILKVLTPVKSAVLSLSIVMIFFRIYLFVYSEQVVKEFQRQNYQEIYSGDTFKITSRLNALSSAINWVCIRGSIHNKEFYNLKNDNCSSGFFQQKHLVAIPHANDIEFHFTIKLPKIVQFLFGLFTLLQAFVLIVVIRATRLSEEQKRKSEILLSKRAVQMSHDIRSPLATLNTVIDQISSIDKESIKLIKRSLERINDISNEILIQNRFENFKKSLPIITNENLNELVNNLISEKLIEYNYIQITLDSIPSHIFVNLEKIEFNRILSNLINNSVEAKASKISFSINIELNFIELMIKDNGLGIPGDILKKLGSAEITTKAKGNGLGIIHARESIEAWSGQFLISSEPEKGTEVKIILPILKDNSLKKLTILIDNDELVRATWEFKSKKENINFLAFQNYNDLEKIISTISKDSPIYIDSELDYGIKGEDIATELNIQGFTNISIASGNPKEYFEKLTFLKEIRNKTPPW